MLARSTTTTTPTRCAPSSRVSPSTLPVRAGAEGKLFGSVTATQVATAIKKAGGPNVDRRSVVIAKPIKTVGEHTVGVKLHEAVTAHLQLAVTAG